MKTKQISVGEVGKKLQAWTLLVEMHNGTAAIEERMAAPQKINGITKWSNNFTSGYISKRI